VATVVDHPVTVQNATPRSIAAVRARVPVGRVGAVFGNYLNQVYAAAKNGAVELDGQNIFVYRHVPGADKELDVEFGVGTSGPFTAAGAVHYCQLPTGEVATATHWGDYSHLGDAHTAVREWCHANNRKLTGTSWEIYGHWFDDPAQVRTDVYYLLEPERT